MKAINACTGFCLSVWRFQIIARKYEPDAPRAVINGALSRVCHRQPEITAFCLACFIEQWRGNGVGQVISRCRSCQPNLRRALFDKARRALLSLLHSSALTHQYICSHDSRPDEPQDPFNGQSDFAVRGSDYHFTMSLSDASRSPLIALRYFAAVATDIRLNGP